MKPQSKAIREKERKIGNQLDAVFFSVLRPSPKGDSKMDVDVLTEIVIKRPTAPVSEFAASPDNAPKWYVNIKAV